MNLKEKEHILNTTIILGLIVMFISTLAFFGVEGGPLLIVWALIFIVILIVKVLCYPAGVINET